MPVNTVASLLENVDGRFLILGAVTMSLLYVVKVWSAGPKTTWERDWAGKMILVIAPPSPVILQLLDHLLHLPSPPQILFLPPYDSPLPESLLTLMHTLRLSIRNPQAQLHCEPLPQTPRGVREFTAKWGKVSTGMTGEGGRRIDAIVFASGWESVPSTIWSNDDELLDQSQGGKKETRWTLHEYHFHILTSLLPSLIRQPPERNIRVISLISPAFAAALPALEGSKKPLESSIQIAGAKSITVLLLMKHFQLIFDTLSAAALKKVKEVPSSNGTLKKKQEGVRSNIMVLRVIMPWTREEFTWGSEPGDPFLKKLLRLLVLIPILLIVTPSPSRAIQPLLFALQAPVRYGPLDVSTPSPIAKSTIEKSKSDNKELRNPRTAGVGNGDIVRYCQVIDSHPALEDPVNAKAIYDALEGRVEKVIKRDAGGDKQTKPDGTKAKA
ncbi:hypothetical protein BD324DRAFT_633748 [Kockovaella imperatae]|uniref:Uncharacterized protein n=1 Tax=Kockovaella imperatae TaxID=4999 RepID=A0A1Y1UAM1_9TREE|nr:hypothetical protein BD324DRAFT_633748 [Kockovaella imperatae]ORX35052.1 hypothetical protein BD324DRAFT_633748 [Kockovaella imperatae]